MKLPKTCPWYLRSRAMQVRHRAIDQVSPAVPQRNALAWSPPACLGFFACDFRKWHRTSVLSEQQVSVSVSNEERVFRDLLVSYGTARTTIAAIIAANDRQESRC